MWFQSLLVLVIALFGAVSCAPEGRVVNGRHTDIHKYPFVVSLRGASGGHSCGSSIIAPRWILTAAHCVAGTSASRISIQYASTDLATASSNVAQVIRIIVHEKYNPSNSFANDIALLELQDPLVYNYKTIAPVTLPDPYFEIAQVPAGAPGILIGWGLNATDGIVMRNLQEVSLKIYSDNECNTRHMGATTQDHICGGVDEGGKGQCRGDSGGPFLYQGSIQVGIVSWSVKPCADYPYPGVYTKVSHYVNWIHRNINAHLFI